MATQARSNSSKIQPRDGSSLLSSKVKIDPLIKDKKKITNSSKQIMSDNKSRSSSVSTVTTKSEANPKTHVNSVKSTSTTSVAAKGKTKREKKVFSLPGQKFDVPEEREPLRIFYESLSKQRPGNEMAEFWLMEHGMLSPAKAKRAFEKKQRKAKQIRSTGTPIKPAPSLSKKAESSHRTSVSKNNGLDARKKMKVDDDSDDDEFILSHKRRKL